MKLTPSCAMLGLVILGATMVAGPVAAQHTGDPVKQVEKYIEEANLRMSELVPTKDYQEKLPFSKFLDSLGKQLSQEKKFAVRLDREAFGKDADKILNEMVALPPVPSRMVANTALRLMLWQISHDYEIEFVAGPGELIITTRDRSLFTRTYDISDLPKHTRFLHETLQEAKMYQKENPVFFDGSVLAGFNLNANPNKADEWIVRQIVASSSDRAGWRNPTRPSTIQVRNGTKLVIHTAPSIHEEIRFILDTLKRLADLAVVMNACLYEVDRATYDKDFASLFVDPKDKMAHKCVVKLTASQMKKLQQQKLVMKADPIKIRPFQQTAFVSLRNAHQYVTGPGDPDLKPAKVFGTVYDGFSCNVRPTVSPDRRCLRLELFQEARQLAKFTKGTIVDLKSGKDVSIDLPNVKKSSTSATIEIHDMQPIVLAVDYRPAAKDRVWLVLAEPMIYIEAEQERLRKEAIRPMLMADETPAPPEPLVEEVKESVKKPPVELANNDEVKQLLQTVVLKVMTDPELKEPRDYYSTRGDKKFALVNGDTVAWPKTFSPDVPGYTMHAAEPIECPGFRPRSLGLRLLTFGQVPKQANGLEAIIEVEIVNVGGFANGLAAQSCPVHCQAKRDGKRWVIQCHSYGRNWERVEQVR